MNQASRRSPAGFTLIEVVVAMAIAMVLAGLCVTMFMKVRQLVRRAEARMAMYENAQSIYLKLQQSLGGMMQHCAFVATSDADGVTLVFMRGKEDHYDWKLTARSLYSSDTVWEEWRWDSTAKTLSMSSSTPLRRFFTRIPTAGWPGYTLQPYQALPQPRRYLNPNPTTDTVNNWTITLNDNRYFPNATPAVGGDVGDYTDLVSNLVPVLSGVTNFQLEFVTQSGLGPDDLPGSYSVAATDPKTYVQQGVWMDGRIGDPGLANGASPVLANGQARSPVSDDNAAAAGYRNSEIAKRPKLLRIMFTVTDSDRNNPLSQTFSFSFALPGMIGTP